MNNYDTEPVTRLLEEWAAAERAACPEGPSPALLARLEREMAASVLDNEIRRVFPWVAAAALAAAMVLAWINLSTMAESSLHPLEALFGLPQTTLEDSFLANL